MPSIANATPQSRARELPDEFIVHQNQLFCKWCSKVLYSLRKDNIHEHLYSRVHQDNRRIQGAKMSYDPDCPERMKRKAARKAAQRKRKKEKQMQEIRAKEQEKREEIHGRDMHYNPNDVDDLDNIFCSDDSDTSSFEGFPYLGDSHSNVEVKPQSSSSTISPTSKRNKAAAKSRNMDYGWQESASSDEDDDYYNYPNKEDSHYDEDEANQSEDDKQPMNTSNSNVYDFSDDQAQDGGCEVVETEIVAVDEAEVVTWDSYLDQKASSSQREDVTEDSGSNLEMESVVDDSSNQTATTTIQMTEEQHLAERVSHAREMAKSVKSTDFKKKNKKSFDDSRSDTKKNAPKKHKQQTGYMLWASKMRRHVSTKFPGMAFGEVSKKLGELWKKCSDKERQMWKFRSEKMALAMEKSSETTKRKLGSRMIETGPPKKKSTSSSSVTSSSGNYSHYTGVSNSTSSSSASANLISTFGNNPPHRNPEQQMERELAKLPAPSIQPIDAAAHIHIMSEHLLKMGDKIRTTGEFDTSEIINKTLDTLMCTIAPLLTLTKRVSGLDGCIPDKLLSETYSNIAHLMPTDS